MRVHAGLHADAAGRKPRKAGREATLLMDKGGKTVNKIYDCNLCMHKEVCDLWSKHECQDASSFQLDGCDYYQDKSRYICVDDINGPGPDPKGAEGEPG